MSNRAKELRQERGQLVEKMQGLTDKAAAENRALSGEEDAEWTRLDQAQEALKARIEKEERTEQLAKEMAEQRGRPVATPESRAIATPETPESAKAAEQRYSEVFRKWAVNGIAELNPEERSLLQSRGRTADKDEIRELRAQGVGTGAAGGFTVPQGFSGEYDRALKSFSGVVQAARIFPTDTGAAMPWPTVNDTAQVGEQLGENTTSAQQDVTFGSVTLNAYKYSSKVMLVSIELMQDSAFSVESILGELAGERIGRILNQRFTTGTGSSQPNGVVTATLVGVTLPAGNTTSVTYDGLIDLEHSVDPAYRNSGRSSYMMHDTTLKSVKKIKDSQNRPLWQSGLKEGTQDTLNGYPYFINQDMAVPAANAKTILFGDFSKYIVRQVRSVFLFRFSEKYMDAGQVGFVAFARYDGNLIDAGTNPIKQLVQSAT
jgi:HK97 family phage major capsid protein